MAQQFYSRTQKNSAIASSSDGQNASVEALQLKQTAEGLLYHEQLELLRPQRPLQHNPVQHSFTESVTDQSPEEGSAQIIQRQEDHENEDDVTTDSKEIIERVTADPKEIMELWITRLSEAIASTEGLVRGFRELIFTTLEEIAAEFQDLTKTVSEWADSEKDNMREDFASYLEETAGSETGYAGSFINLASLLNSFNPDPCTGMVIGVSTAIAGEGVSQYEAMVRAEREATALRMLTDMGESYASISEIRTREQDRLLADFHNGARDLIDIAWECSALDTLSMSLSFQLEHFEQMVKQETPEFRRYNMCVRHAGKSYGLYSDLSQKVIAARKTMPALVQQIRVDGERAFEFVRMTFLEWLAGGFFRYEGNMEWDETAYGGLLYCSNTRMTQIGNTRSGQVTQASREFAQERMEEFLSKGVTIEYIADTVISRSTGRSTPIQLASGTVTFTITNESVTAEGPHEVLVMLGNCPPLDREERHEEGYPPRPTPAEPGNDGMSCQNEVDVHNAVYDLIVFGRAPGYPG